MFKLAPTFALPIAATAFGLVTAGEPEEAPAADAGQYAQLTEEPPPLLIKPLSKSAALELNQSIPFSRGPIVPAESFRFTGSKEALARARECLASAIYYEAASQSVAGQQAVAQVVLNRVRHPAFPASICGTVYQGFSRPTGCQFSFTCDTSLIRQADRRGWAQARQIAQWALSGGVYPGVGLATHYHANYVVPYWATSLAKRVQVGSHIFYAWPGQAGQPRAFGQRYARQEGDPARLRAAALIADGLWPGTTGTSQDRSFRVEIDRGLELAGIIGILAGEAGGRADYVDKVLKFFAPHSNHLAVQISRSMSGSQLASLPGRPTSAAGLMLKAGLAGPSGDSAAATGDATEPVSFATAARDFAVRSDFARFFRANRAYYSGASAALARAGSRGAANWETYTGLPVERRPLLLAFAVSEKACASGASSSRHILALAPDVAAPDSIVEQSALGDHLVASAARAGGIGTRLPPAVKKAIVTAVFSRIHALSGNTQPLGDSSALARTFEQRLRVFERDRERFPTLADFLPTLLAGVERSHVANGDAANGACAGLRGIPG